MENTEKNLKSSRPISLLLLIPALIFGIISMALAIVGLGLIPILPAMIGIILSTVSFFIFNKS
jgi:CHASE2 domain-containing sensor protein